MQAYESITFEVEKDLKKPTQYLKTTGRNFILSNLFKRRKFMVDDITGRKIPLNINEPLEILHHTFDTDEQEIYNVGKTSLIQGLISAYKNHYPITISPDMIWILIMQGFSRFMEKYENLVRERFVNFSGKKDLKLERMQYSPYTAKKDVWDGIIKEFVQKIGDNV